MKPVTLLFLVCLTMANFISAQSSVKSVVKQLKKTERYEGVSIPGWLVRLGLKLVPDDELDNETRGIFNLASKIKHVRIASTKLDISKYNAKAIVQNFAKKIRDKDQFEDYVSVRSEDTNLNILVQEEDDTIKNLVIMTEDQGEISFIHLKTDITVDDLKKISFRKLHDDSLKLGKSKTTI